VNSIEKTISIREKYEEDPADPQHHTDGGFCIQSYVLSTGDKFPYRYMDKHAYSNAIYPLVQWLFANSQVLIACDPDLPDVIYGFIMYQTHEHHSVIHYMYVKKAFRGYGIASQLVKAAIPNFGQATTIVTQLPPPPGSGSKYAGMQMDQVLSRYRLEYDGFLVSKLFNARGQ
jgi:GNAT superfamily N-acetyltransferase